MTFIRSFRFVLVLCLAGTTLAFSQSGPPRVDEVEPPNWWIGLPSPMLLLTGEGLADAKVTLAAPRPGVTIERTENGLNGKYLFVWLKVTALTKPGEVSFKVSTASGQAAVRLPLERRDPAATKMVRDAGFNGISSDDVIVRMAPGDRIRLLERMPAIKEMGATIIRIVPAFTQNGVTDFFSQESAKDLDELTTAAHASGMKVLMDLALNHTGAAHSWVKSPPSPYWFHGTPEKHLTAPASVEDAVDPHSIPRMNRTVTEGWIADKLPDLNTFDPRVKSYLTQNAMWWVESGALDGLLLDDFAYVDRSYWHEMNAALHKAYPRLKTAGEVQSADPAITSFFAGGRVVRGVDSGVDTFIDSPMAATLSEITLRNAPMGRLASLLRDDSLYPHPEDLVLAPKYAPDKAPAALALDLLLTLRGVPLLDAAQLEAADSDTIEHVKAMLKLRKEHVALRRGRLYHAYSDDKVYAFVREYLGVTGSFDNAKPEVLLVVANNADELRTVSIETADSPIETALSVETVLGATAATLAKGRIEVTIGRRSLAIYNVKCGCFVE